MTKFERVCKALQEKTRNTNNYVTVTKNVDGRHKGCKYAIRNIFTNNVSAVGYKTLKEIIDNYELII